jgi:hypothetical protein
LALLVCAALASSTRSEAQILLKHIPTSVDNVYAFPYWDWMPDIDGDGIPDTILGDAIYPYTWPSAAKWKGRARVYSGGDGHLIRDHVGAVNNNRMGWDVASIGDVNGNGVPDYAVEAYGSPFGLHVFEGQTGATLLASPDLFGYTLAGVGDVNLDGTPDFIANVFPGGKGVSMISGATFQILYSVAKPASVVSWGEYMKGLDDVDSDGVPDFTVSAPGGNPQLPQNCSGGYVGWFSGTDGHVINQVYQDAPLDQLGSQLAAPGDITGDGYPDVAVGAYTCCGFACTPNGKGRMKTLDGFSGGTYMNFNPEPYDPVTGASEGEMGSAIGAIPDLNANGFNEVCSFLRTYDGQTGHYPHRVFDGHTGNLLMTIFGDPSAYYRGVRSPFDANADGFSDIALHRSGPTGMIDIYSGTPPGVSALGKPCKLANGMEPRIATEGAPTVGGPLAVNMAGVGIGQPALLILGASSSSWNGIALPLELSSFGMPRCEAHVSPEVLISRVTQRVRPGEGWASVGFTVPNDAGLAQQSIYAQWLVLDPGTPTPIGATTRTLKLTFQ